MTEEEMLDLRTVASHDVPAWRQELKRIVDFLNRKDEDSMKLWWVLTALRGPDTLANEVKFSTISVIRHTIGLEKSVGNGAIVSPDDEAAVETRVKLTDEYSADYWDNTHFRMHSTKAFEVLGLKWNELNEDKTEERR